MTIHLFLKMPDALLYTTKTTLHSFKNQKSQLKLAYASPMLPQLTREKLLQPVDVSEPGLSRYREPRILVLHGLALYSRMHSSILDSVFSTI